MDRPAVFTVNPEFIPKVDVKIFADDSPYIYKGIQGMHKHVAGFVDFMLAVALEAADIRRQPAEHIDVALASGNLSVGIVVMEDKGDAMKTVRSVNINELELKEAYWYGGLTAAGDSLTLSYAKESTKSCVTLKKANNIYALQDAYYEASGEDIYRFEKHGYEVSEPLSIDCLEEEGWRQRVEPFRLLGVSYRQMTHLLSEPMQANALFAYGYVE